MTVAKLCLAPRHPTQVLRRVWLPAVAGYACSLPNFGGTRCILVASTSSAFLVLAPQVLFRVGPHAIMSFARFLSLSRSDRQKPSQLLELHCTTAATFLEACMLQGRFSDWTGPLSMWCEWHVAFFKPPVGAEKSVWLRATAGRHPVTALGCGRPPLVGCKNK